MNVIEAWQNGMGQICDFFGSTFDWLWNGVVDLANGLLGNLANFIGDWVDSLGLTIEIPENVFDVLNELTIGIGYIIPVRALLPIPLFMLSFYVFKVVMAIYHLIAGTVIKRIKLKL